MAKQLMKVIGYTNKGIEIVGELMYGRVHKGKTTYYVSDNHGIIHECIFCKDQPRN